MPVCIWQLLNHNNTWKQVVAFHQMLCLAVLHTPQLPLSNSVAFLNQNIFGANYFFLAKFYLINIFWTDYFFTIFFGKNFLFLFELKKNWISKACILNLESPLFILILNHFIVTQKLSLIFLLLRSALIINTWFDLYFFPSLGFINPVFYTEDHLCLCWLLSLLHKCLASVFFNQSAGTASGNSSPKIPAWWI